ncbi:MAG: DUF4149 domain-containing protein [Vicinamibacterales bacterium]
MIAVRYVYVLALVVWLGGMVVLGAVVAPTIFQVLQAGDAANGRALAGAAFEATLVRFHTVAYVSGGLLLLTLALMRILGPKPVHFNARVLIVLAMLGLAMYSGWVVLGRIDEIQAAVGTLPSRLPAGDPRRLEFDSLHTLATRLMSANIVGALILLYWEARES